MKLGDVLGGRFQLEALLGAGGMGRVFRALDGTSGERVALKIAHGLGPDDDARFTREAEVLKLLDHPAIVRHVAHGKSTEGERWLAMQWLDGEPLSARLRRGPLSVPSSIALALRLAEALGVAHAAGVVHRDLKPANVVLVASDEAQPVLVDFGIARVPVPPGGTALTRTGLILGTPGYMAPEQSRGEREIDGRADIFSLGCVLYQCLTGHRPFHAADMLSTLLKVVFEEPAPPSTLAAGVPPWVDRLVARLLAKAPTARFANGAGVVQALAEATGAEDREPPTSPSRSLGMDELRAESLFLVWGDQEDLYAAREAFGEAVERERGELARLADGTWVASFGTSGSAHRDFERAARAALAARRLFEGGAMAVLSRRVERAGAAPRWAAIEGSVELIARSRAHGGAIALDAVSAGLLAGRVEVERDGVQVFLRAMAAGPSSTASRRALPFVGRSDEVAVLETLFEEACNRRGARTALVSAPAGVGKSRLVHEFTRRLASRGEAAILRARADALGGGASLGLLGDVMRSALQSLLTLPLERRLEALAVRVASLVPPSDAERVAAFVGLMLGIPPAHESELVASARQDPVLMGDQLRRACEDLLGAETERQPVVVVLEDLHWGDLATVRFFEQALRNLADRPLLLVVTARPEVDEVFPRLWAAASPRMVQLQPLAGEVALELGHRFLGTDCDRTLLTRVVALAAGNAFYLGELLHAVAAGQEDALPQTALAMAAARISVLPEEARRVLRAASVFGQASWREGIGRLLGEASPIDDLLDRLIEQHVIERQASSRFPGTSEIVFRHSLLRDAAYALLTETDRALAHGLAGDWLEERGETGTLVLAEHHALAGRGSRAAVWFRRAAAQALEGNDFEGATRLAARGLAVDDAGSAAGALHILAAEAHRWRGQWAEAATACRAALAVLDRRGPQWVRAMGELGIADGRRGQVDSLRTAGAELLALGRAGASSGPYLMTIGRVAGQLFRNDELELGDALVAVITPHERELTTRYPVVVTHLWLARMIRASVTDDVAGVLESSAAGLVFCERAGDVRTALVVRGNVGAGAAALGLYAEAVSALRSALADGLRMGISSTQLTMTINLGLSLAPLGHIVEAEALLRNALKRAQETGDRRLTASVQTYLAKLLADRSDLYGAEPLARSAIAAGETAFARRPMALSVLARCLSSTGRIAEAVPLTEEAVAALGSGAVTAESATLSRLVAAEVHHMRGDLVRAKELLRQARTRLLESAARIPRVDWRASFLSQVPDNARTLSLAQALLGDAS